MHTNRLLVIAGSGRPRRRAPAIASWVAELGDGLSQSRFEVIDVCDLGLGLDDEPIIPAKGDYHRETTRRWSQQVRAAAGLVFVTPQYNWGYPAALKNAIDHLHGEWRGKPALIVTYGAHGGGKCAAQLRQVLEGLDMCLARAMPGLRLSRARIEADDGFVVPAADFESQREELVEALGEFIALAAPELNPA